MSDDIPEEIRAVLACPRCRGPLDDGSTAQGETLVCSQCALVYPVEDGIPVLLVERATALGAS